MPNWKHIPVGYHGRSSTVVVSGTHIRLVEYKDNLTRDEKKFFLGIGDPMVKLSPLITLLQRLGLAD